MYASFPMFLYLNASLGGLLLDPLLQYQNSKLYNNPYAAPDLGGYAATRHLLAYPNVALLRRHILPKCDGRQSRFAHSRRRRYVLVLEAQEFS